MAGHSKWANIKHRKARQDASRGKVWTKVIREITVAAKGGPDPDDNPRLRLALDKANAANMPKDNIKRAIEKGSGTGDTGALEEIVLEGYGPGGVAIMVEAMSDNRNRTVSDVRHAFSKFGGNLGTDGSVSYLFNKIGIIHVAKTYSEEDILDIALEAGADDLVDEEDYFEIITSSSDLENVLKSLKENNIENTNAELTLRAETSVSVDKEMSEKVLKIMDFMDELDDVQEVHTNAEFPENFEVKEINCLLIQEIKELHLKDK
jgi:YebC/PmpR family DNA-binding regulatory protein